MAYNLQVTGGDAKVLTPDQQIISEIVKGITTSSTILPLMRRLPDATTGTATLNVLDTYPVAFWVDEGVNGGLKQTTNAAWKGVKMYMQEIAVLVPIKKNVLDDAAYDIFGEIRPLLIESANKVIDEAIILGKNKPALFREGIIPSIYNAGKNVKPSTNNTFVQISDAMSAVETSGYNVTGLLGGVSLKGDFRKGLVDQTGQPLANSEVTELPRVYAQNGAWDNSLAKFVVGDFSQAVYTIRQDVTFEMFDTGVIQDADGKIIYNLMQQDMVALRMVMRMSWALPNPVNILDQSETRFPFALVENTEAPATRSVTFTVTDADAAPVAGARVTLGGNEKKTNASGMATFKSLGNAKYAYAIEKADYNTAGGTISVASEDVNVEATLNK
jgi:HK97 family phage major capsid protein